MPRQHLILTAVGSDRPGLVKRVAELIHSCDCNIEDSRMAILAGEFALILLFSGEPASLESARQAVEQTLAQKLGFVVSFKEAATPAEQTRYLPWRLSLSGSDQPGIVHRVSGVFAELDVNVASLESHLGHAAFSGTPIFNLHAELQIPGDEALQRLRSRLGAVCDELDLAYVLDPSS
jgi:glycine cleavage system transcriptional repressor